MAHLRATLLGFIALVCWPGFATAHAFLEKSAPEDGAVLNQPPQKVELWFSRSVEPAFSTIRVTNAKGKDVNDGKAAVGATDAKLIAVGLKPLTSGTYKVVWRIVALDGHKAKGEYTFTVK